MNSTLNGSNSIANEVLLRSFKSGDGPIGLLAAGALVLRLLAEIFPLAGVSLNICLGAPAVALLIGTVFCTFRISQKLLKGDYSTDIIALFSLFLAYFLAEYTAGTIVVLMLTGGATLETFAESQASFALRALADRLPNLVRKLVDGVPEQVAIEEVKIDDLVEVLPHEIVPFDGVVEAGSSHVDESFLTGEPYELKKTKGSAVLSGSRNGQGAFTVRVTRTTENSRYTAILETLRQAEQSKPQLRKIGDKLGVVLTAFTVLLGSVTWILTGESTRMLAVFVSATPCPLIIGIPVALVGALSCCASRGIIVRNPSSLEILPTIPNLLLDKTGTLTGGRPVLAEQRILGKRAPREILQYAASVEQYSRHPLAVAITHQAEREKIELLHVESVANSAGDKPSGAGISGLVGGHTVKIVSTRNIPELESQVIAGLSCAIYFDEQLEAIYLFRDVARPEGVPFISHLGPAHGINKIVIISGDAEENVSKVAKELGILESYAEQTPQQKLAKVREFKIKGGSIYVGDGINDAPSLAAATVGISFGSNDSIVGDSADIVLFESNLYKVDELFHIARYYRSTALIAAVGGVSLSLICMVGAALGYVNPTQGAIVQEIIDIVVVLFALRSVSGPKIMRDV